MFSCLQGRQRDLRMIGMARGNQDCIDIVARQQLPIIACNDRCVCLFCQNCRRSAGAASDTVDFEDAGKLL